MSWQALFPYVLVGLQILQVLIVGIDHWWTEHRPQMKSLRYRIRLDSADDAPTILEV